MLLVIIWAYKSYTPLSTHGCDLFFFFFFFLNTRFLLFMLSFVSSTFVIHSPPRPSTLVLLLFVHFISLLGLTFAGCYKDGPFMPANLHTGNSSTSTSPLGCVQICGAVAIAVAVAAPRCFCFDVQTASESFRPVEFGSSTSLSSLQTTSSLGKRLPDAQCPFRCSGLPCGGYFAMSVYTLGDHTAVSIPTSTTTSSTTVHVIICSEGARLVGAMAAMNSVETRSC